MGIELGAAAAVHVDTSRVDIEIVECRHPHLMESFSYAALIHDKETGSTATIDTAEAPAIEAALKRRGWTLTHILITHHHIDHTLGNVELIKAYPKVKVYGGDRERELIPGITHALLGNDNNDNDNDDNAIAATGAAITVTASKTEETFRVGSLDCVAIDTAGHTVGHVAYYFPAIRAVFCGDALFTLGVGRMMEGNAQVYWDSMKRFKSLPDNTVVYSAHEYAESNAAFALSIDPTNETLRRVAAEAKRLRHPSSSASSSSPSSGLSPLHTPMATMPSLMWQEKEANPFLRADNKELRESAGIGLDVSDAEAFRLLREAKDTFSPKKKVAKKAVVQEGAKEGKKTPKTPGVRLGATAAELVDSSILEIMMITNHEDETSDNSRSFSTTSSVTIPSMSSYSFVVRDRETGRVGLIDPAPRAVEAVYSDAIEARNWESPSALFFTSSSTSTPSLIHDLRKVFPSIQNNVFGGSGSAAFDASSSSFAATDSVPGRNASASYHAFTFGATEGQVIPIRGAGTSGLEEQPPPRRPQQQGFAFHFPTANVAFVGNAFTLLGYREKGKEAKTTEGWHVLRHLRDALSPSTVVYTTQESAGRDAQFAVWADGGNFNMQMAVIQIARRRAQRPRPFPTVPFVMSDARIANPFLRMDIPMQKESKFTRGSSLSAIRAVAGIDLELTNDEAFEELLKKREMFFGYAGHKYHEIQ